MNSNWVKVFASQQMIRAEIVREKLEQSEIAAVILDKKDSNYPVFGQYEVHVPESELSKAQLIVADEEAFGETE